MSFNPALSRALALDPAATALLPEMRLPMAVDFGGEHVADTQPEGDVDVHALLELRLAHAADGRAVLRHGRREAVRLVDVPAEGRPAILRRYLAIAPGARPHIPAGVDASDAELQQVAATTPVFEIVTAADAVRRATATGG